MARDMDRGSCLAHELVCPSDVTKAPAIAACAARVATSSTSLSENGVGARSAVDDLT